MAGVGIDHNKPNEGQVQKHNLNSKVSKGSQRNIQQSSVSISKHQIISHVTLTKSAVFLIKKS